LELLSYCSYFYYLPLLTVHNGPTFLASKGVFRRKSQTHGMPLSAACCRELKLGRRGKWYHF
jgi:hypothetical protein